MKCLSIQQPWAQYIAAGIKDVENRSWGLKTFPQRVLIHTGKKKQIENYEDIPLVWALPIENAEHLGIVPLIDDMPTGAIIGMVDIVGCTMNAENDSVWSQFSDDPKHPIYNLMLANAKLFKEPILNVKGKQGIFEYAEITEDNLPECVEIPSITRQGSELFIPVDAEEIEDFKDMDDEGFCFDYHLLDKNLDLFAETKDDELVAIPTEYITVFHGNEKVRVKVVDTEIVTVDDEDGNEIHFTNPQGDDLVWMKIYYSLVPENAEVKDGHKPINEMRMDDALSRLPENCRNIITMLHSDNFSFEYHKDPESPYADISTELDNVLDCRLDADFVVNTQTGIITLNVYPEFGVPKKSIKKAIEKANEINSSSSPAWVIINTNTGGFTIRVANCCPDAPITSEAAQLMLVCAIEHVKETIDQLKEL
ncbi:MAG: ASCH domain-containing protein [Muribaculum sp.]|nr:ASCH domain-containing protein [Muribaculum sp.]